MRGSLTTGRPAYVVEVACCMGVGAWLYVCALVSFRDECDSCLGTQLHCYCGLFVKGAVYLLHRACPRWTTGW